jgi:hypothetical protein
MSTAVKRFAVIMVIASLIFLPAGPAMSQEREASAGAMIVDALVVRPLGFVALVTGSVVFVISYPFAAAGGNVDDAVEKLVKEPARFTFDRPLGDI